MNVLEIVLCVAASAAAAVPLAAAVRRWPRAGRNVLALSALTFLGVLAASPRPAPSPHLEDGSVPAKVAERDFVSSDACRCCHPEQYASWHDTYHRTMTQLATPEAVLAPFEGLRVEWQNRTYTGEQRGDEVWVTMPDPDWEEPRQDQGQSLSAIENPPLVTRPIVMTTGSHHMQGYWINGEGNVRRQFPFYWVVEAQRWVPRDAAFLRPPSDHRYFAKWDQTCIQCHSVGGNPRFDENGTEADSEIAELGISCEACHGPALEHVRTHRNPLHRYARHASGGSDPTIVNPARVDPVTTSEICGQCHSSHDVDMQAFRREGLAYRAGGDLHATYDIFHHEDAARFSDPDERAIFESYFWKDGTNRTGGDEYNGLIESACYREGEGERKLTCLSCHSMHASDPNDQLAARMDTNDACLQCHAAIGDELVEHTYHAADSSGSQCYNCHMPHTTYALYTAMRSHTVDIPDIATSVRSGRPNACNLCHLDRTAQWAADQLTEWYGTPAVRFGAQERRTAASVLWLLKGDAAQRVIAAWHMGWKPAQEASGNHWQAPLLAPLLEDPYAAVRYVAGRSLRSLPGFAGFAYDFMGSGTGMSEARRRVPEHWKRTSWPASTVDFSALPMDADRNLQQELIDEWAAARDDTPVLVPE